MLKLDDAYAVGLAARALATLGNGSQEAKDAIIAAGALPLLVAVSNFHTSMFNPQKQAAAAIEILVPACSKRAPPMCTCM